MLNLHLSDRDREAFFSTLTSSHRIKIVVHIHNEDENRVNDFDFKFGTTHILEGSVQLDTTQDVTRSLSMTFLDPFRRFRWTPDRTSHGALYTGDFISVLYCVHVNGDNQPVSPDTPVSPKSAVGRQRWTNGNRRFWVNVPVFWGPLTAYEANGPAITIEAQGKESLAMAPYFAGNGYTLHKHDHVDDAMKEVLRRIGERRFKVPDLPYRLGANRAVHPLAEPWKIINGGEQDSNGKHVAGLIHKTGKHPHHAYYNAEGQFTVKRLNKDPIYRFDSTNLLSEPDVTYDVTSFINTVLVRGAKPQGKGKKPVHAKVSLPAHNPNSPQKLARNGVPRELILEVNADNLKTERDCRQRAHHLLNHHSKIGVEVSFDALPVPTLEEGDVVKVRTTDGFELHTTLKQMTLPLTSDQGMSVGYNKRLRTKQRHRGHGGPGGRKHHHPNRKASQSA